MRLNTIEQVPIFGASHEPGTSHARGLALKGPCAAALPPPSTPHEIPHPCERILSGDLGRIWFATTQKGAPVVGWALREAM